MARQNERQNVAPGEDPALAGIKAEGRQNYLGYLWYLLEPAISTADFPDVNGSSTTRHSVTGDIGIIVNQGGAVNPFVRYGRSYRHPNLEELFFAGPATAGSIVSE